MPNRHNNINEPPLLWAVFIGGNMESIKLSQKAEEEIVNAARMAALSNLTEKSQNLITLEDIAIYFGDTIKPLPRLFQ